MPTSYLRNFINQAEENGDLIRISTPVDPLLEIAAITDRVSKMPAGGSALLFEQPLGSSFTVATNLFGSMSRVCLALGISTPQELADRLETLMDGIPNPDISIIDAQIAALEEFAAFTPIISKDADPDLYPMDSPDLTGFPFLHGWPQDGSADGFPRYMTLPQVFTASPDGADPNCGVYRVQLRGKNLAAIQWKAGSGGARHAEQHRLVGKRMPVAIVLGGPPAALFSAMFPLPGMLDELTFAGFMGDSPLTVAPCQSVPLHVPTGAEVIIEGYVEPGERVTEGPFGNHTGYYAPAAPAALLRVTAVSHRPNPVIPATVVGPPPMEDCRMMNIWEPLLLSFLRRVEPAIRCITFPDEWVFRQSGVISLEKPHPGMVRRVSSFLWSLPWFASARVLIFVTAGIAPPDISMAAWHCINRVDFTSDILMDSTGRRVALDATGAGNNDSPVRRVDDMELLISKRWKEYGLP